MIIGSLIVLGLIVTAITRRGPIAVGAIVVVGLALGALIWRYATRSTGPFVVATTDRDAFDLHAVTDGLGPITRLKFTPDGETLLVATLSGQVWALPVPLVDGVPRPTLPAAPALEIQMNLPFEKGPIPNASGLSGLILGADFATSRDVFLTHVRKGEDGILRNMITRATLDRGKLVDPTVIFVGNASPAHSHQIQGGVGVLIDGKPHVLFTIGDATVATNARDPRAEVGKLMLVTRDGEPPAGVRPFPEDARLQAIGLRNAYDVTVDPVDPLHRVLIPDTGPESGDRLLYGSFLDGAPRDFGWDGTIASLATAPESVFRWDTPVTPADVVFLTKPLGRIAASSAEERRFLQILWGSYDGKAPRTIVLGTLTDQAAGLKVTLRDLVQLESDEPHAPLGLDVEPRTGTVFFGDMMGGALYALTPKGR